MLNIIPWDTIKTFIKNLGLVKGTFVVFFWIMHAMYFRAMRGRLEDRQKEIDRVAAENHEYRERFLAIIDKNNGYKPKKGER